MNSFAVTLGEGTVELGLNFTQNFRSISIRPTDSPSLFTILIPIPRSKDFPVSRTHTPRCAYSKFFLGVSGKDSVAEKSANRAERFTDKERRVRLIAGHRLKRGEKPASTVSLGFFGWDREPNN